MFTIKICVFFCNFALQYILIYSKVPGCHHFRKLSYESIEIFLNISQRKEMQNNHSPLKTNMIFVMRNKFYIFSIGYLSSKCKSPGTLFSNFEKSLFQGPSCEEAKWGTKVSMINCTRGQSKIRVIDHHPTLFQFFDFSSFSWFL